ncbi:MAG: flagellar biosynthetic protein FliR [Planctomycetota bacterium]|jgi:flagellar biosynthetic protein FliR
MDIPAAEILGFVIVLTRISFFLAIVPIFGLKTISMRIKLSIVLLVSFFFAIFMPTSVNLSTLTVVNGVLMIAAEAIYGIALGTIIALIFSAVKISGKIVERQMGFAMGATYDPLTGESADALSVLLEMLFILLFLSANGHHLLLLILAKSYQAFPAGTTPDIGILTEGLVVSGSTMLVAGLRLAGPLLAAFLLLLAILAVFARIMPDMNILFISMPLRVGLGLLMVGVFLPFINQFVSEFADWMGKLLPL